MKVLKFSFLFYSFFFCLGIAIYSTISIYVAALVVITSLVFIGISSSSRTRIKRSTGIFYLHSFLLSLLFLFSGSLVHSFYDYKKDKKGYYHYINDSDELTISFIVEEELKVSNYKRFYGRIININDSPIDPRILLVFTDSMFNPAIGSQYLYRGKLNGIPDPKE